MSMTGSASSADNQAHYLRATGQGSRLELPAVLTVTNGNRYNTDLYIDALTGGFIDLSQVGIVGDDPASDSRVSRIRLLADGTGSALDVSALTTFSDRNTDEYSELRAVNGGEILASNLTELQAVALTLNGTGTLPVAQITRLASCSVTVSGVDAAFPVLTDAIGTTFTVWRVTADLGRLPTLQRGELWLHGGGMADVGALENIDGASLYIHDGVALALPAVEAYSFDSTANNQRRRLWVTGIGSALLIPNATAVINGTHYNSDLSLDARLGGHLGLPSVRELTDPSSGDTRTRAIDVRAYGAGSVVDLTALESFTDRYGTGTSDGQYSTLSARLGGTVRLPAAAGPTLQQVSVTMDAASTIEGSLVLGAGSVMQGEGTVTGMLTNTTNLYVNGTLSAGDYVQTGDATLWIDLAGTTSGTEFDRLLVAGAMDLAGDLRASTGSFVPASGDTFPVLSAAEIRGNFDHYQGLAYGGDMELTPVLGAAELTLAAGPATGPSVTGVTPAGTVANAFSYFDVAFDEQVDASAVDGADLALTGPGGAIDLTGILRLSALVYRVRFAAQTEPGLYELTVGPNVPDYAGNLMAAAHTHAVTLDDGMGPILVSVVPAGLVNVPVTTVRLTFDEPVDAASFTADDVSVAGPSGPLDPGGITVTRVDDAVYDITFPAQDQDGVYTITVGPGILDLSGNAMDAAGASLFYAENFESGAGGEWSSSGTVHYAETTRVAGLFRNEELALSLAGLPAHTSVAILADLVVIDRDPAQGAARWSVSAAGLAEPLFDARLDAFPALPHVSGEFAGTTPGMTDLIYRHVSMTFAHAGSALEITFRGDGFESEGAMRWALDNVRVLLDQPAPGLQGNTFTVDRTPPVIVDSAILANKLTLVYADANGMDAASVTEVAHYALYASGGDGTFTDGNEINRSSWLQHVNFDPDVGAAVVVMQELPQEDEWYQLRIDGVTDAAGNALAYDGGIVFNDSQTIIGTYVWVADHDGDWENPLNWQSETVPAPGADVLIDKPGITVSINSAVTVHHLDCAASLRLNGSVFTVTGTATVAGDLASIGSTRIHVTTAGASLHVAGAATLDGAWLYTAAGGEIRMPGATSFSSGRLILDGAGPVELGALTNLDHTRFFLTNGATFTASATVTTLSHSGGIGISEKRTIISVDGVGSRLDLSAVQSMDAAFSGLGGLLMLVEAKNSGQIDFSGMASLHAGGSGANGGGPFELRTQSGGQIDLSALTTVTGSGQGVFINLEGAEMTLPSLATAASLRLQVAAGASLGLPVLTSLQSSTLTLAADALADAPLLAALSNATVSISGSGELRAPGLTTIDKARILLTGGAVYVLPATVTSYDASGGVGTNEQRTVFSVDGTGTRLDLSALRSITATFNGLGGLLMLVTASNNGVIDLSGIETVYAGGTGVNGGGPFEFRTAGGGRIDLSSLATATGYGAGVKIDVRAGGVTELGAHTTLANANILVAATGEARIGTLELGAGAVLTAAGTIEGNLVNGGTVRPGSNLGVLTVDGDYTQTAAGRLTIEIGGTEPGVGYDRLAVTGVADLAGLFEASLTGGFVPASGQTYEVMTYGSLAGGFDDYAGLDAGGGIEFVVDLGATRMLLQAEFSTGAAILDRALWSSTDPRPGPFIDVTFSEPIRLNTFTVDDIALTGPSGESMAVIAPVAVPGAANTYRILLEGVLFEDGTYTLRIGPDVLDLAGNPMNQDGDDVNGHPEHDVYETVFDWAFADLRVASLTWEPETLTDSDPVLFTVVVENVGAPTTSDIPVRLERNGVLLANLVIPGGIDSGASALVEYTWFPVPGLHTVRAAVNPDGLIPETRDDNNAVEHALPEILDQTAPVIHSLAPADGGKVQGAVAVKAVATDNLAVTRYDFERSRDTATWTLLASGAADQVVWDTAAVDDGEWFVRVSVYDAADNVATHVNRVVVDNLPPPPVVLSGATGEFRVNLSWTASDAPDVAYYRVRRGTVESGPYTDLGGLLTATTYTDRAVTADVTYYYVVVAFDQVGNASALSNEIAVTPAADLTPPVIQSFTPAQGTRVTGTITLAVTATDNAGVVNYRFEYSTDQETWLLLSDGASATYAWDTVSVDSGDVYVRVTVADARDNTATLTRHYAVDHLPPPAPENMRATPGEMRLTVAWDPVVAGDFAHYRLTRSAAGGPFETVQTGTTSTVFIDTLLDPALTYTYRVVSVDLLGNASDPHAEISAQPLPDSTPPVMHALVPDGSVEVTGRVPLTATAVDNVAVSLFRFAYRPVGAADWLPIGEDAAPVRTAAGRWQGQGEWESDAVDEGGYELRATAVDPGGNTHALVVVLTVDRTAPATPEAPAIANPKTGGRLALSWTAVGDPDVAAYGIYRTAQSGQDYARVALVDTTSFTDTGLQNDMPYYYVLTALDWAGNESPLSPEAGATPTAETDLSVFDLVFAPTTPVRDRENTITATVWNTGLADAATDVTFYKGDSLTGTAIATVRVTVNAGGARQASVTWVPTVGGPMIVTAVLHNGTATDTDPSNDEMAKQTLVNIAPVAAAGGNREGDWNAPIAFDGGASSDEDGLISTYRWDFGDGQASGYKTATYAYPMPGVYTATLAVTDNRGASSQDTFTVTVHDTRADLVVSGITWNPIEPEEGDTVTITAAIANVGNGPTTLGFFTTFYIDGQYQGYQLVHDLIGVGETVDVPFTWVATRGLHTLEVIADDIQNNINEIDEDNNSARTALTLQQIYFPDLVVEDLVTDIADPGNLSSEQRVTATATIANRGDADAGGFHVSLYLSGNLVAQRFVGDLAAGATVAIDLPFDPVSGAHTLTVKVDDPVSRVLESDETNNALELLLPELTVLYPDLTVHSITILPADAVLSDGTSFDISATIRNTGAVAVTRRFAVSYYLDGEFIGLREIDSLGAGASRTLALQGLATPGPHTATVIVDEANAVAEADETNNRLDREIPAVEILYTDLEITDVKWTPLNPLFGEDVVFTVTVTNNTVVTTLSPFGIALYLDGEMIAMIASLEIPKLTGNSSMDVPLEWEAFAQPRSTYTLTAVVDPLNTVMEESEDNNTYVVADHSFVVADNFAMEPDAFGGAYIGSLVDLFAENPWMDYPGDGTFIYLSDAVAEVVVTVRRGLADAGIVSPDDGVESFLDMALAAGGDPLISDLPMTYDAVLRRYTASLDLSVFQTGTFVVTLTCTDGVKTATRELNFKIIEKALWTLETDKEIYQRGEPVVFTGTVTTLAGLPIPLQSVLLSVAKGKGVPGGSLVTNLLDPTTRTFTVQTDFDGAFTFTFQPLAGDAGHFNVESYLTTRQVGNGGYDFFEIRALDVDPGRIHATVATNQAWNTTFTLENPGDTRLTGLNVTLFDADTGDNVAGTVHCAASQLAPDAAVPITVSLLIPEVAPDSVNFEVRVTTAEGVTAVVPLWLRLVPARPIPRVEPNAVNLGVNPGGMSTVRVRLTNAGLGTMRGITVLPSDLLPWVAVSSPAATDLAPGADTTFDLLVAPPAGVPYGLYIDTITVTDGTVSARVTLSVEVTSSDRGGVSFVLASDSGLNLDGTEIQLVSREEFTAIYGDGQTRTYHQVYRALTDATGMAGLSDIPIGLYDYVVAAPGHDRVEGELLVMPLSQPQVLALTLQAVPLSYEWTVKPIIIEDTYDISLTMTFATEVQRPVFATLPPWIAVPHELQEVYRDQVIIVNPSLIALNDVRVTVVGASGITLSAGGIIGDMPARSTATLGVHIEPGDYEYLHGERTYLLITGTYVEFDPVTLEPLPEETVAESKIPLVNPTKYVVSVGFLGLNVDEGGDSGMFRLPQFMLDRIDATEVVKLELSQTATLEREGFDARLKLTNGIDKELIALTITPRVTDEFGADVTDRFYLVPPELQGIGAVDGSASLGAFATMNGRWILIPGADLGGTDLAGKSYWVQAMLSYYVDGVLKQVRTDRVEITVHPQPQLYLHYYLPRDVVGEEPFKLGLLVENVGDGVATNFKIESGQPKIVENLSGLAVEFAIIGTSFGSQQEDRFTLVLGDIPPHSAAHGYWIMTSSLDGRFEEFEAEFSHRAYKGVQINPMILGVDTRIILHDNLFADAQDPDNAFSLIDRDGDGFPDYLINLWSGLRLPIAIPDNVNVTRPPTPENKTMELEVPDMAGYIAVIVPEPYEGTNLRSVTRLGVDGEPDTILSANNFWIDNGNIFFVDELGYIDEFGERRPESGTYVLDFRSGLQLEEIDVVPVEFSILYSAEAYDQYGMPIYDAEIEVNPPQGDTALTTYVLTEPIFYLHVPPTEGQRAVVQATLYNAGVGAETTTIELWVIGPDGVETQVDSFVMKSEEPLRPLRRFRHVFDWVPETYGLHTVVLRIQNDAPMNEIQRQVYVNAKPFADAGADFSGMVNVPVTFDGSRSIDEDGFLRNVIWDFGDGTFGAGTHPSHVYTHSATYKVRAMVQDNTGAMSEDVMQVTIYDNRPDLVVSGIVVNPAIPAEGDPVTLTATIENRGTVGATTKPFLVGFYVDGAFHAVAEVTDLLPPGGTTTVDFTWTATLGNHLFTVWADDFGNVIDEVNEGNNKRTIALYPEQLYFPDLTVDSIVVLPEPGTPVAWGAPLTVVATVRNQGTREADAFRVQFYVDGAYAGHRIVQGLSHEDGINTAQVEFTWKAVTGEHTLTVEVDAPISHIVESDEENNARSVVVPERNLIKPDLVLSKTEVWPAHGKLQPGDTVYLFSTVTNASAVPVHVPFIVRFEVDGAYRDAVTVPGLAAGESRTLQWLWEPAAGTYTFGFLADAENSVPEVSETNNSATTGEVVFTYVVPDLRIQEISVIGDPLLGSEVMLAVRYANQGSGRTPAPFNLRLLIDGEIQSVKRVNQTLSAGNWDVWYCPWTVAADDPSQVVIGAVIDANQEIDESNELNNAFSITMALDEGYLLDLQMEDRIHFPGESIPLTLTVADIPGGSFLGPADGVSAAFEVREPAGAVLWTGTFLYEPAESRFDLAIPAGALPVGWHVGEAIVTAPEGEYRARVELRIAENFAVTVATGQALYPTGEAVTVTGSVLHETTGPAANARVVLVIAHEGTTRRADVFTAADGGYAYTFVPGTGEAGSYTLSATAALGGLSRSAETAFAIEGLHITPAQQTIPAVAGHSVSRTFTVANAGALAHGAWDVRVEPLAGSPDIAAIVSLAELPATLASGEAGAISVTFDIGAFAGLAGYRLVVGSTAGGEAYAVEARILLDVLASALVVDPGELQFGVLPGQAGDRGVRIANAGPVTIDALAIAIEGLPWFQIVWDGRGEVLPGADLNVLVRVSVPEGIDPGRYGATLRVTAGGEAREIPIQVLVAAPDHLLAPLLVTVRDPAPVAHATVTLTLLNSGYSDRANADTLTHASGLIGVTDEFGQVLFDGLLPGRYAYRITAPHRIASTGTLWVDPGLDGGVPELASLGQPVVFYGSSVYVLTPEADTWDGAAALAAGMSAGLVEVNDAAEQAFLADRFFQDVWIGLTRSEAGAEWLWAGGDVPGYVHWGDGEPSADGARNRGAMAFGGDWYARESVDPLRAVLEAGVTAERPQALNVAMEFSPIQVTFEVSSSTNPAVLGLVELNLTMETSSRAILGTDRPGAEFLMRRDGLPLSDGFAFLDPNGPYAESKVFTLINHSEQTLYGITLTAHGAMAGYVGLGTTSIASLRAGESAVVRFSVNTAAVPLDADQVFDGYFLVKIDEGDPVEFKFPIRIRVAAEENLQAGEPYTYLSFAGPYPDRAMRYGRDFVDTWFGQIGPGAEEADDGMGGVRVSAPVVVEGETFRLDMTLRNALEDESLTLLGARPRVRKFDATRWVDVTDKFEIVLVTAPRTSLGPGEATAAAWDLRPKPGSGIATCANAQFEVSVVIDYATGGRQAQLELGPVVIQVRPEPDLVFRYEISARHEDDPREVLLTVYVDNNGCAPVGPIHIGLPQLTGDLVTDATPFSLTIPAGGSGTCSWVLEFAYAADADPDEIERQILDQDIFGPKYFFVSQHSIEDLVTLLKELVDATEAKMTRELLDLAEAFNTLEHLFESATLIQRTEILIGMAANVARYAVNVVNFTLNAYAFSQTIAENAAKGLVDSVFAMDLNAIYDSVQDFRGKVLAITIDPTAEFVTRLSALSVYPQTEALFEEAREYLTDETDHPLSFWQDFLFEKITYPLITPRSLLEGLGENPSPDAIVQAATQAMRNATGMTAGGVEIYLNYIKENVEDAELYMDLIQQNSSYIGTLPIDTLYANLDRQLAALVSSGIEGVAQAQGIGWYAAGTRGNYLPPYLQEWVMGGVGPVQQELGTLLAEQYDNLWAHYDILQMYALLEQASLISSAVSLALGQTPKSGGTLSAVYNSMMDTIFTQAVLEFHTNFFPTLRAREDAKFRQIIDKLAEYIGNHQYEAAGVYNMSNDFEHLLYYLIEERPIDPEITLSVDGLNFSDVVIEDNAIIGMNLAEVSLRNTGDLDVKITPVVDIYGAGRQLVSFTCPIMTLPAGGWDFLVIPLQLLRSSLVGPDGYDIEITLIAEDPDTLSRSVVGPLYAHVYAGTEAELALYRQQTLRQPLGGAVGDRKTIAKTVQAGPDTESLRILLMHPEKADLDLHIYDAEGRHVGFDVLSGEDVVGIPDASYNGSNTRHQVVWLKTTPGAVYTVEIIVNRADRNDRFSLSVLDVPAYAAALAASTHEIVVNSRGEPEVFTVTVLEQFGSRGVTGLQAELGVLEAEGGVALALDALTVQWSASDIAAAGRADLRVEFLVSAAVLDGRYTGVLRITGQDAVSGEAVALSVPVRIDLDRVAPAAPSIETVHNDETSVYLIVEGVSEPDFKVEVFANGKLLGFVLADASGRYAFQFLPLGLGEHEITARAIDAAGNASDQGAPYVFTSTYDADPPPNNTPVANASTFTVTEGEAYTGALTGTDADGDALTFAVATGPALGTLNFTGTTGAFTYTAARQPAADFVDSDHFTFRAWDGKVWSELATVTITILPSNRAPIATPGAFEVAEGATHDGAVTGTDADGDELTFEMVAGPALGTLVFHADGAFTYTAARQPTAGFVDTDYFTFRAYDGSAWSDPAEITITITPVNDAPVAVDDEGSTSRNRAVTIDALVNDSDPDGDPIHVASVTQPANGSAVVNPDGTVTYTPQAGWSGIDPFTYTVSDDSGATVVATVTVTVQDNTAPSATPGAFTVTEGATHTGAVTGTDADGDALTFEVVTGPALGALVFQANGSFIYTAARQPTAGFVDTDYFTFRAFDGSDWSAVRDHDHHHAGERCPHRHTRSVHGGGGGHPHRRGDRHRRRRR